MLTGAHYVTNQVPNWIYVTPNGYTNAPSPDVIGRIAFNVYDVGGLLDANVAGFAPNQGTTTLPPGADTKGPAVWADLRAIPGVNSNAFADSPTWPPQWRLTGDWKTFATNSGSSLTYYERTGWRDAYLNANGINSDRMFASRQDLIRYAKAQTGTFTSSDGLIPALQYLTTFSRDLNAPSYRPDPARPKVQQPSASGGNDAHGLDPDINPPLLTAVNSSGDSPAITKRFPLSRLAMVATPVPPASPSGNASKILEYFGLTWDSADNQWTYDHGNPGKIYRLNEVPSGREPDFFELLKAAISVGSLGKQFGIPFPAAYDSSSQPNSLSNGFFGSVNYQIVQIAANIIDQYDADSYPTRITFDGKEFYGVEDLPYIYKARTRDLLIGKGMDFGFTIPATDPYKAELKAIMVSPELWNPHKPSSPTPADHPKAFRIVASTFTDLGVESTVLWKANPTPPYGRKENKAPAPVYRSDFTIRGGPDCSGVTSYSGGQGSSSAGANAALTFNYGANNFREPKLLDNVPGASGWPDAADMALNAAVSPSTPDTKINAVGRYTDPAKYTPTDPASFTALGFVAGYLPQLGVPNADPPPAPNPGYFLSHLRGRGGPISLDLQYQDPGDPSVWWTIDKLNVAWTANPLFRNYAQSHTANRIDPRSERWGSIYSADDSADTPIYNIEITANPALGNFPVILNSGYVSSPTGWAGVGSNNPIGMLQQNTSTSTIRYTDPDGVRRGAAASNAASGNAAGWPMITGNNDSRPEILNRPFRSVAELGYVFRGTPWRHLDFTSPESGDRALLDVFCVNEGPDDNIVAGKVNLNTRQAPVIQALLQGAGLVGGTTISETEAVAAAKVLLDWTASTASDKGPLRDRSELIGRFVSGTTFAGPAKEMADKLSSANARPIQRNRNMVAQALADAGTTRAWNFLMDTIAQSGSYTTTGGFFPKGESRIWTSIAIDRHTAKVIDHLNEVVTE